MEWLGSWAGIEQTSLVSGSKSLPIPEARAILSYIAVRQMGMQTTHVADLLQISQSAVSKLVQGGNAQIQENGKVMVQLLGKS